MRALALALLLAVGCAHSAAPRDAHPYRRPMVKAGVALTVIGSLISIVGSTLYFATDGDTKTAGLVMAPSAEPLMITGTVLWVVGLLRAGSGGR